VEEHGFTNPVITRIEITSVALVIVDEKWFCVIILAHPYRGGNIQGPLVICLGDPLINIVRSLLIAVLNPETPASLQQGFGAFPVSFYGDWFAAF